MKSTPKSELFLVFLLGGVLVATLSALINIPPYMDEIFHIPQAVSYCKLNFSQYDPMITTFPGLYIIASLVYNSIACFFSVALDAQFFRVLNVLMGLALFETLLKIRRHLFPDDPSNKYVALSLATYPLSFFYFFLFYTDTASSLFVALTYLLSIRHETSSRASLSLFLVSSGAILMRQTNAVWVLCICGQAMLDSLTGAGLVTDSFPCFPSSVFTFIGGLLRQAPRLLAEQLPLVIPVVLFIIFVVVNKGIVVGDKEHHQMVVHGAMPLHLLGFAALSLGPLGLLEEVSGLWQRRVTWFLLTALFFPILYGGCLSHPFLLADNRHYSFYLYRILLSKPLLRSLLLAPAYAASAIIIQLKLRNRGPLWIIIYVLASVITLVPSALFEPRYFTQAVIILGINTAQKTLPAGASTLLNFLINIITLWIFIMRPFYASDGEISRFMF